MPSDASAPSALDTQIAKFSEAMESRVCMPSTLVELLDGAVRTGHLPRAEDLAREIEALAAFDGRMPCGYRLWDAEEVGWCTVRHHYGWGLPTEEALDFIETEARARGDGRLLEIGCGSGYWAAVLAARGLEVIACDTGEWKPDRWERKWHEVVPLDGADAVRRYPGIPVLMVWADPNGFGTRVADAMEPGRLLLRAGAEEFTGGDAFNQMCRRLFDPGEGAPVVSCTGRLDEVVDLDRRVAPALGRQVAAPAPVRRGLFR